MIKHKAPCPFPWTTKRGDTIIDEMCSCHHRRTDHRDRGPAYGHGECAAMGCDCERYTWHCMIGADPKAAVA